MFRKYWFTGFIAFIGLLILSMLFYKERMIFTDAAFYQYIIVRFNDFFIAHNRFIGILPQLLPVAAMKMGGSLHQIMLLYSISFVLFHFIFYILTWWADKSYRLSLVILFLNILSVTETFYWMLSELTLGISVMLFLFALLVRWKDNMALSLTAITLLLPVIVFAHPYLLLPFGFLVCFYWLREGQEIQRRTLYIISAFFILILIVKFTLFRDPYDKGSLGGLRNFLKLFPDYFTLHSNKVFLQKSVTVFAAFTLIVICNTVHYVKRNAWKTLGLFLLSTLACIGFVNICFPYEQTPEFYRENLYTPLAVFAAVPFVYDVLPAWKGKVAGIALGVICIFGLCRIYFHHQPFTERLAWLRSFWLQHKDEKLIIPEQQEHIKALSMTWATPYEFWLLSTADSGKTASIMITDHKVSLPPYTGEPDIFLHRFAREPYSVLPKRYFVFTDSSVGYTITSLLPPVTEVPAGQ